MKKVKSGNICLVVIGIVILVLGIVLPFALNKKEFSPELNYSKKIELKYSEYSFNITSEKELQINSIKVFFNTNSNHKGKDYINVEMPIVEYSKLNNSHSYNFVLTITGVDRINYIDVNYVEINSDLGYFKLDDSVGINFNWKIPVIIISVIISLFFIVAGIIPIISNKKFEKEIASIQKSDVTEIFLHEQERMDNIIKEAENNTPQELPVCEYCGEENELEVKKCVSCGAKIKKK